MAEEFSNESNLTEENPLGEKLSQMLADPESMARLAKMASALAGTGLLDSLGNNMSGEAQTESPQTENTAVTQTTQRTVETPPTAQLLSGKNRHAALLRALKPYLGTEKRERIDRMLKLLQLAEVAGTVLYSEKDG